MGPSGRGACDSPVVAVLDAVPLLQNTKGWVGPSLSSLGLRERPTMHFLAFAVSLFSLLSALSPGLALPKPRSNRNSERSGSPFMTVQGTSLTVNGK